MTTKDELNGQTEKRTDKKDDTLSKAEKILDKYLNTNIMDEAIPSILEAMEAYHKYRVNAISDEEKLKKYYKYLCEIGVISNEYSGDSDVDFYYYTFIDTYPCLNCFNQICECDE